MCRVVSVVVATRTLTKRTVKTVPVGNTTFGTELRRALSARHDSLDGALDGERAML